MAKIGSSAGSASCLTLDRKRYSSWVIEPKTMWMGTGNKHLPRQWELYYHTKLYSYSCCKFVSLFLIHLQALHLVHQSWLSINHLYKRVLSTDEITFLGV